MINFNICNMEDFGFINELGNDSGNYWIRRRFIYR